MKLLLELSVLYLLALTGITCTSSCPDDTVDITGCKCRQTRDLDSLPELICDDEDVNVATVIQNLNTFSDGKVYPFESLQWENGVPVELKDNFFGNITFRKLQIGTPLHYCFVPHVSPKAFLGPISNEVEWLGIRSYELNKEKDLFKAVSVLPNLEYLAVEGRYLTKVPQNAFNKDCGSKGKCNFPKLKKINFTEGIYETFIFLTRLEKKAFYNLPSLEEINMKQQDVAFIGDYAFATKEPVSDKLVIDLSQQWNRKFTPESFSRHSLSNINRQTELILYGNQFITYLPEEAFKPFFEENPGNTVRLGMKMNCSCEMLWLYSQPEKYQKHFAEWTYLDYEDDDTKHIIHCQEDEDLWNMNATQFDNCNSQGEPVVEAISLDDNKKKDEL